MEAWPTSERGALMTFRELSAVLWRRKLTVLLGVVVAVAAAGAYLTLRTPSYQATATVQLQAPASGSSSPSVNLADPLVVMASPALAHQAAAIAGAPLDAQISAAVSQTTNVMTVTATGPAAVGAERTANAYAKAYVAEVADQAAAQVAKIGQAMNAINATIAALEARDPAGTNPGIAAQITSNSQTYAALAAQQVAININGPYATIQNPATVPGAPAGSSKTKVGGVAALAGLLAGCGLALVREQFDTRLSSDTDVAEATGRPVLAELPVDDFSSRSEQAVAVIERPDSLLAESIRELRTSMRVILEDKPGALVMVTSPAPGDGKTFVVANLAAAWAMSGRTVIVVSADFRRPRIEQMFGIPNVGGSGLAGLTTPGGAAGMGPQVRSPLPARADIEAALFTTRVGGLYVLPSGGTPSQPSELLDGPAMAAVTEELSGFADVVLFDAPPVMAVTDAAIMGRSLTGIVVVGSEGRTGREDLVATVDRLEATGGKVLGVVLNRVGKSSAATYHPYYRNRG
jgi:capsular exopolysaccharide synthesis family protein